MFKSPNRSTLSWLEIVFKERFGHDFVIEAVGNKRVDIRLATDSKFVSLVYDTTTFEKPTEYIKCGKWNAEAEGWVSALGKYLPAPGQQHLPSPLIEQTKNGMHIHYDILSLVEWMLTRREEVDRENLDEFQRFPATSSHAFRWNYLERPIVDEWLDVLGQVFQRIWPTIILKKNLFKIILSHDIDAPSRYGFLSLNKLIRNMAHHAVKRRDFRNSVLAPWVRLNNKYQLNTKDPYNTFDWIMDLSEELDLKSAFYFICGHTDPRDADYSIDHPAIQTLMHKIHKRGHEIGLHPSFNTYDNPDLLLQEANTLREMCTSLGIRQQSWGGRMHYLRWKQPITMRAWAAAGLHYDSTLGYADHAGFRCGTCYEYPAFDPIRKEEISLRIRPLIAMEASIISPNYMNLGSGEHALNKFKYLKNICRSVGGNFSLLWHNSYLEGRKDLYRSVLEA